MLNVAHHESMLGSKFDVYSFHVGRWKLSEGNSDTVTQRQMSLDPTSAVSGNIHVNCTPKSRQLASISDAAQDICSFVADQPAKDLQQYVQCLQLVSRGLVAGKVQPIIDCLHRLVDEDSMAEMASMSSVSVHNGNVVLCIMVLTHCTDARCTAVLDLQFSNPDRIAFSALTLLVR